jgi:S-methylmethionine-dependent homocysteine/selenocysteine methylase
MYSVFMVVPRNAGNAPAICVQNCFRQKTAAIAIAMMQPLSPQMPRRLLPNRQAQQFHQSDKSLRKRGLFCFAVMELFAVP